MKPIKLFLVLLFTLIQGFAYAQTKDQKSTIEMLMSTKWFSVDFSTVMEFDSEIMAAVTTYGDREEKSGEFRYYLSDSVDATFNHSLVGTVRNGRYLIYLQSRDTHGNERFNVTEIMKINKNNLVMRYVAIYENTSIVRSSMMMKYKAIK